MSQVLLIIHSVHCLHSRHEQEHLDLAHHTLFYLLHLVELVFVVDLDGDCVSRLDVQRLSDHGIGALPEHLAEAVLVHRGIVERADEHI